MLVIACMTNDVAFEMVCIDGFTPPSCISYAGVPEIKALTKPGLLGSFLYITPSVAERTIIRTVVLYFVIVTTVFECLVYVC